MVDNPISFQVHIGFLAGATGQEKDIATLDLCVGCASMALQRICNLAKDFDQAIDMVSAAVRKQPLAQKEVP